MLLKESFKNINFNEFSISHFIPKLSPHYLKIKKIKCKNSRAFSIQVSYTKKRLDQELCLSKTAPPKNRENIFYF